MVMTLSAPISFMGNKSKPKPRHGSSSASQTTAPVNLVANHTDSRCARSSGNFFQNLAADQYLQLMPMSQSHLASSISPTPALDGHSSSQIEGFKPYQMALHLHLNHLLVGELQLHIRIFRTLTPGG